MRTKLPSVRDFGSRQDRGLSFEDGHSSNFCAAEINTTTTVPRHYDFKTVPMHGSCGPIACRVRAYTSSSMPSTRGAALEFPVSHHLCAISPYFNILKQPAKPESHTVDSAVYLFRHGIIHVSGYDYQSAMRPFLQKIREAQKSAGSFARGPLRFLETYSSWITEDHIGKLSAEGLEQTREIGRTFRKRYETWFNGSIATTMKIWTDSAPRCALSARAFAEGLSGNQCYEIY
jgi:hypothetical protein